MPAASNIDRFTLHQLMHPPAHTVAHRHGAAIRSVAGGMVPDEDDQVATDAAMLHLLQVCSFTAHMWIVWEVEGKGSRRAKS